MKKTFLFLANGFEEIEALATVDVLRRGGIELVSVSIHPQREVTGAHGVSVLADMVLADIKEEDAECLIFPGGMPGAKNLGEEARLIAWMQKHYDQGKWLAAICAAPALVFSQLKASKKYKMTCYPGFESYLENALVQTDGVVVDEKIITAKGPAFAVDFGLTVLEHLTSGELAAEVAAGMLK